MERILCSAQQRIIREYKDLVTAAKHRSLLTQNSWGVSTLDVIIVSTIYGANSDLATLP